MNSAGGKSVYDVYDQRGGDSRKTPCICRGVCGGSGAVQVGRHDCATVRGGRDGRHLRGRAFGYRLNRELSAAVSASIQSRRSPSASDVIYGASCATPLP